MFPCLYQTVKSSGLMKMPWSSVYKALLGFPQSGTTSAAKSVVRINLQARGQFIKGQFLQLTKTLQHVTGWCCRGGRRADSLVTNLASTISWLLTLPCYTCRKGKLASLEPALAFCRWTLTAEAPCEHSEALCCVSLLRAETGDLLTAWNLGQDQNSRGRN